MNTDLSLYFSDDLLEQSYKDSANLSRSIFEAAVRCDYNSVNGNRQIETYGMYAVCIMYVAFPSLSRMLYRE